MDGAGASGLYRTVDARTAHAGVVFGRRRTPQQAATSRRAVAVRTEALGASPGGAAAGADLGGSSKYSNENFEG